MGFFSRLLGLRQRSSSRQPAGAGHAGDGGSIPASRPADVTSIWLEGNGTFGVEVVGESHYQDALERAAGGRTPEGALARRQGFEPRTARSEVWCSIR